MIYLGNVVKVSGNKLFVTIPVLGGKSQFGPLPAVIHWYSDEYQTDTDLGGGGMVEVEKLTYYKKGDRVVIGQIGKIKEDLVVLGKVAT